MPQKKKVICVNKTLHHKGADGLPVIMVQFNVSEGIGSHHFYMPAEEADGFTLGKSYDLTLNETA